LHSEASEEESTPLAITCEDEDIINASNFTAFPAVPCYLEEWVKENQNQQFQYDEASGAIKDLAHGWELCSQNGSLSLCAWDQYARNAASSTFSSKHSKWHYDGVT